MAGKSTRSSPLYKLSNSSDRDTIFSKPKQQARDIVDKSYPYGLNRSRQEVATLAEQSLLEWAGDYTPQSFFDDYEAVKRFYIPIFVDAYFDRIAEKSGSPQGGARAALSKAEHISGLHSYTITVTDTLHLKRSRTIRMLINDKDEIVVIEEVN